METELQMAFKRKEALLQDFSVNSQTSLKMEKDRGGGGVIFFGRCPFLKGTSFVVLLFLWLSFFWVVEGWSTIDDM
jgi:hypothetical protein